MDYLVRWRLPQDGNSRSFKVISVIRYREKGGSVANFPPLFDLLSVYGMIR